MKRAIIAGLVAGIASGIVMILLNFSGLWESLSVHRYEISIDMQISVLYEIIQGIIWGVIWSVFYAIFYNYIPAKGLKKGLIYGLIIWTIAILRSAQVWSSYGGFAWAFPYAFTSFFSICITYGLVLGLLYRKPSD